MTDISVVIVNYRTPDLTNTCLDSIKRFTKGISYEIIIVDNHSEDQSKEIILSNHPDVVWVDMPGNDGTSRGYNAGVRAARSKYVIIMNSDTELIEDSFTISLSEFKKLEADKDPIGMYSCQIREYDGKIQLTSHTNYPSIKKYIGRNPIAIKFGKGSDKSKIDPNIKMLHEKQHETKWIGIVFGLINKHEIFDKEQLYFDEDIFMYSDEVEWCYRLNKLGFKHFYSPSTYILHLDGGSSLFSKWRFGQITLSEWLYFMKVNGKLFYLWLILIILSNHFLDSIFYLKQKLIGRLNDLDKESKEERKLEMELIRKYFGKILFRFKSKPSSSKTFLKYQITF